MVRNLDCRQTSIAPYMAATIFLITRWLESIVLAIRKNEPRVKPFDCAQARRGAKYLDSRSPFSRRDKFRGNDRWSAGSAGEYLNRLLGSSNVL